MISLLFSLTILVLILNIAYFEYRFVRKDTDINLMSRYNKLMLLRRYK